MLLPAMSRAKSKEQRITCVNNLKQISLGLRLSAGNNDDKYPWRVDQSSGCGMPNGSGNARVNSSSRWHRTNYLLRRYSFALTMSEKLRRQICVRADAMERIPGSSVSVTAPSNNLAKRSWRKHWFHTIRQRKRMKVISSFFVP